MQKGKKVGAYNFKTITLIIQLKTSSDSQFVYNQLLLKKMHFLQSKLKLFMAGV